MNPERFQRGEGGRRVDGPVLALKHIWEGRIRVQVGIFLLKKGT